MAGMFSLFLGILLLVFPVVQAKGQAVTLHCTPRDEEQCKSDSARNRTIGYYQSWNMKRSCGSMTPEEIPEGYTHINFAFAYVQPKTFKVAHMDKNSPDLYRRVMRLKASNPGLQVWISISGGAMSPGRTSFSDMASTEKSQYIFIDSLIDFIHEYGFDGVDLNWEYPTIKETGGKPSDYDTYVHLVRRLRARLEETGEYGLSVTLPHIERYIKGYNVRSLQRHIDWFNFMTYDFHGKWDLGTNAQYAYAHTNLTKLEEKLGQLWERDVDPGHVVMGLAFYGRSFTLKDKDCTTTGCPISDVGKKGKCTNTPGMLSADEIGELIKSGAKVKLDKEAAVRTVTWDKDQWISYDDPKTLKMKLQYASSKCLGGTFAWAINFDDHSGTLIKALR